MFENNASFEKETNLYEKAVLGINRLQPDFVVITGDFVHDQNSNKQINEFKRITAKINPDIPVYSVGDLVDRGNFSYEVLEFIKKNKIKFTAGNHDLMFYYYVTQPTHPIGKSWIYNGSESTMEYYSNYMPAMREHFVIIKKAEAEYCEQAKINKLEDLNQERAAKVITWLNGQVAK